MYLISLLISLKQNTNVHLLPSWYNLCNCLQCKQSIVLGYIEFYIIQAAWLYKTIIITNSL